MKEKVSVIKESYKNYRFKNERYKVSADYKEYCDIANKFIENLFNKIVTSGLEIELPSKMGTFVLEQYDVENYINNLKSKGEKYWSTNKNLEKKFYDTYGFRKEIPHDPSETDGKMWTFSWLRNSKGTIRNKHLYSFFLVRSNVRSSSNRTYSDKYKRLTVHDFYKERGYKIYRNIIRPDYSKKEKIECTTPQ